MLILLAIGILFGIGGSTLFSIRLGEKKEEEAEHILGNALVLFIGAVFQVVSMGMNNFIRADGNPRLAMLTMFVGAGTNIILDPIFIYGYFIIL